ncbi:MAG: sensor histidine kinase, partial [Proteobacteria bacterium]
LLRARGASPEAKEALREAAGHARALANVHRRLEVAEADECGAYIESVNFIKGLVEDLDRTSVDGLRPVALRVDTESHILDTERAVTLGLVLNELVTNALKYAFPDERHGTIAIRFCRIDECFELVVEDDGIGLPRDHDVEPSSAASRTLGTRLLRGLAAQLRGGFRRSQSPSGGTRCVLSFAAEAPILRPQSVGT